MKSDCCGHNLGALPGPCEGPYGTRRHFYVDGVSLHVPDMFEDKMLRYLIDQGMRINDAYGQMMMSALVPPQGLTVCCKDALRTKWYNPESGRWELSGWGFTCSEYYKCFVNYVDALRATQVRGRIKIAQGVYVPSPWEETCIRRAFVSRGDVTAAYSECDASDILPKFPGAIDGLNRLLASKESSKHTMYDMIKTLYELQPQARPPTRHAPIHRAPPGDKEPRPNYILYAGIGVAAALLITRL